MVNYGGLTSNSWKTPTTIEVNCGGLTSNSWNALSTIKGNCGGGWCTGIENTYPAWGLVWYS